MKNLLKMVVCSLIAVTVLVFAGCGLGDKYVGTWVGYDENDFWGSGGYLVSEITIEKNGKGYLIKENKQHYVENKVMTNEKEYNRYMNTNWWEILAEHKEQPKPVKPIYHYTYIWQIIPVETVSAVQENNKLVVDGTMGLDYFTAVEKDGTLLRAGQRVYKKKSDTIIEDLKKQTQKYFKDNAEKNNPENTVEFTDGKNQSK